MSENTDGPEKVVNPTLSSDGASSLESQIMELCAIAIKDVRSALEELHRDVAPVLDGQTDAVRNVVTLSSATLVLSISAVQFLAGKVAHVRLAFLLPASWAIIAAAIGAGLVYQAHVGHVRAWPLLLRGATESFQSVVKDAMRANDNTEAVVDAWGSDLLKRVVRQAVVADWLSLLALGCYGAGIATLIIFATINLPF